MMTEPAPMEIELIWSRERVFTASCGSLSFALDGDQTAGPSPMQALAAALAGCMAIDLVTILKKGRHDLRGLRAHLSGRRAPEPPRRFVGVELRFIVEGSVPPGAVQRAVELSRAKYCSVWHSLRQDIEFTVTAELADPSA